MAVMAASHLQVGTLDRHVTQHLWSLCQSNLPPGCQKEKDATGMSCAVASLFTFLCQRHPPASVILGFNVTIPKTGYTILSSFTFCSPHRRYQCQWQCCCGFCLCTLQALRKSWSCLLVSHQHGNIRPHVQLFLLVLLSRQPAAVPALLLPALEAFNTSSYQVSAV